MKDLILHGGLGRCAPVAAVMILLLASLTVVGSETGPQPTFTAARCSR